MMDFRTPVPFGQTGLRVSRLGIGSSFAGDPAFIEEAVDQGVNYLYWGTPWSYTQHIVQTGLENASGPKKSGCTPVQIF